MTRRWDELVAIITDVIPMPVLLLLSLLATALIALALYFWPAWLPWNWRLGGSAGRSTDTKRRAPRQRRRWRIGALRWRRRRRRGRRIPADPLADLAPDELPDLPADVMALTADQLAAAGRYAEAVRERLRAIVRALIEREIIPHSPGWTVTELARAAGYADPDLSPPLRGAVTVFSEIWYGLRPAIVDDDTAMRGHAAAIARITHDKSAAATATSASTNSAATNSAATNSASRTGAGATG